MKLHDFYRRFDALPKDKRFELIIPRGEPTSFFVIFQRLTQVRAQKRFYEEQEFHLLAIAEEEFKKMNG